MATPLGPLTSQEYHALFQDWKSYKDLIVSPPLTEEDALGLTRTIRSLFDTALNPLGRYREKTDYFISIQHDKLTQEIKNSFPIINEIEPFYYPALEDPPLSAEDILVRNQRVLDLSSEELENKLKNEFDDAQKHLNENENHRWNTIYKSLYRECVKGYETANFSYTTSLQDAGFASTQGDVRKSMEDDHLVDMIKIEVQGQEKLIPVFGIFDGHGGPECSNYLARYLCPYLEDKFRAKIHETDLNFADLDIFNIFKLAFVELSDMFQQIGKVKTGSTATIALIIDQNIWVVNVGDSRAILSIGEEVIALSEDADLKLKKYLKGVWKRGQTVFKSIFNNEERINGNLAMARAVGHNKKTSGVNPRPKIIKYSLKNLSQDAYLTIACDGLWDVASSKQVAKTLQQLLKEDKTCTQIAFELTKRAFSTGSNDNISILVVKIPSNHSSSQQQLAPLSLTF